MFRKSIPAKFTLMFLLTLFFVAGSVAGRGVTLKPEPTLNPPQLTCATVTDDQIKKAIFKTILADSQFKKTAELKRLNFDVFVTNKMVELVGSVDGAQVFTKILKLIKGARADNPGGRPLPLFDCYAGINVLKFFPTTAGHCGENEKDCRGRCISATANCEDFGSLNN